MIELCGLTPEGIEQYVKGIGESAFRARQIAAWVAKGVPIHGMTNLSAALRARMGEDAVVNPVAILEVHQSKIDGTQKFLFELRDGHVVEGVLMRYKHGATLCLSTQVGCKMGCAFCASTLDGCVRNLTPGEMIGQILCANDRLMAEGARVHNLVLMGSGEPFDNYENVVAFLRVATDERLLNQSVRGISLSTCGLVPRMRAFAGEGLPVTLSLSLHAPNDAIRRQIMPIANVYSIDETMDACRHYIEKTGRRIVIEYILIDGLNTGLECVRELAKKLRGLQCHVNLIPYNEVKERHWRAPSEGTIASFLRELTRLNISATRRREMGDDIQGACGQLRRSALEQRIETQGQ